jgi:hypothetical protein
MGSPSPDAPQSSHLGSYLSFLRALGRIVGLPEAGRCGLDVPALSAFSLVASIMNALCDSVRSDPLLKNL